MRSAIIETISAVRMFLAASRRVIMAREGYTSRSGPRPPAARGGVGWDPDHRVRRGAARGGVWLHFLRSVRRNDGHVGGRAARGGVWLHFLRLVRRNDGHVGGRAARGGVWL